MTLQIKHLTGEKLRRGDFKSELPEFYALGGILETNAWHLNQDVLVHAILVVEALQHLLSLDFLEGDLKGRGDRYLRAQIGKFTRKELLVIAALLHDIAKTEVYISDLQGRTRCPGHEIIGATRVSEFSNRFGLDEEGEERVKKIVHFHGFAQEVVTLSLNLGKIGRHFEMLKNAAPELAFDLSLFVYADMSGSDLKKINEIEFDLREKIIKDFIKLGILGMT